MNAQATSAKGDYVLYWMIANRRTQANFSLQRAVDWAVALERPLVILEALRVDYRWASRRIHQFIIQGMADNANALQDAPVVYYPYVERNVGDARGLLDELARRACVVVSDDFPCFFLPRMLQQVAERLPCRVEAVDANGLLPLRAADQVFPLAHTFRRFLQRALPAHLSAVPLADPLQSAKLPALTSLPSRLEQRWPRTPRQLLSDPDSWLMDLPIDHQVGLAAMRGGAQAAQSRLRSFVDQQLPQYPEDRNHPDRHGSSGLSPYLHFGHLSVHQVFEAVMRRDGWQPKLLSAKVTGSREGWWNASPEAEAFLDELVTWREVGYNFCWQREDYDQYDSLPAWAQTTLRDHQRDVRRPTYELEAFEAADTHDAVWNAIQNQLVREGRVHNYLRMLWGKKILEWSASPRVALEVMIDLNNKYAVDGRNPNSYSGIFWTLGRYDRAWGPERPIFGKIRYMSSDNTVRKVEMKQYLSRFGTR